jgi:hypothetical protein
MVFALIVPQDPETPTPRATGWQDGIVQEPAELRWIKADLQSLQALVGGDIEAISGGAGWSAIINGEGKIYCGLNIRATNLALQYGWPISRDVLFGPVVFLGPVSMEGEETSFTEHMFATAQAYLGPIVDKTGGPSSRPWSAAGRSEGRTR